MKRKNLAVVAVMVTAAALAAAIAWAMVQPDRTQPKHRTQPDHTWIEPYGGCKEAALYPGTQGWKECKERGLLP